MILKLSSERSTVNLLGTFCVDALNCGNIQLTGGTETIKPKLCFKLKNQIFIKLPVMLAQPRPPLSSGNNLRQGKIILSNFFAS